MNIAAAFHCYDFCRGVGNREGALRHLNKIRSELNYRGNLRRFQRHLLKPIGNTALPITMQPRDEAIRVDSIFDAE